MGKTNRLKSLDALRGLDMFFITGGAGIIVGLCAGFGCGDGWLAQQMRHVPWAGLAHHDTIFPLFLFLAGASWPFSLVSQQARGRTLWQIHRKIVLRMLILTTLGMTIGGLLKFNQTWRIERGQTTCRQVRKVQFSPHFGKVMRFWRVVFPVSINQQYHAK